MIRTIMYEDNEIKIIVSGGLVRLVTPDAVYRIYEDQFNDDKDSHVRSLAFAPLSLFHIIMKAYDTYKFSELACANDLAQRFTMCAKQ